MSHSSGEKKEAARRLSRGLEYVRNRGEEIFGPVTRSQSGKSDLPVEKSSLELSQMDTSHLGAVGGLLDSSVGTGAVSKQRSAAEQEPSSDTRQQGRDREAIPLSSELKSAINVAILQAHETYRSSQSSEFSNFKDEMRKQMLDFMMDIQQLVRPSQPPPPEPPKPSPPLETKANPLTRPTIPATFNVPPPTAFFGAGAVPTFSVPPPALFGDTTGAASNPPTHWDGDRGREADQRGYTERYNGQQSGMQAPGADPQGAWPSGGRQPRADPIKIQRWGILFDGGPKSMPVKEFIFRVEHMQKVYNVPWSDVIRDFHALVDGRARDWFWTHVRTATILDWPNLRYCLEQHFQSRKSSFEQEQDLRERKQRPGESIDDYLQEMISLRSRLPTPFSDHDLIKTIKINIRDGISRVIYPMAISNLEKLRDECHEAERWLATRWTKPAQPLLPPKVPRHHVQEAYVPVTEPNAEEEEGLSVEALYRPREGGGNLTCWNCSQAVCQCRNFPSFQTGTPEQMTDEIQKINKLMLPDYPSIEGLIHPWKCRELAGNRYSEAINCRQVTHGAQSENRRIFECLL
ncbi:hypothetical protein ACLKA7_001412 [Drosophila subpalustris]